MNLFSTYTENFGENNVLSVQPGRLLSGDEELRSVGVLAGIGHRQPSGAEVLQLEVLIGKLLTVNGTTTGTCK